MKYYVYDILSSSIVSQSEVSNLTKLQKFICKKFKINHEKKYYYYIDILFEDKIDVHVGDIVLTGDDHKWRVLKIHSSDMRYIHMTNIEPYIFSGVFGKIAIVSRIQ